MPSKEFRKFDVTLPIEAAIAPPYQWYTEEAMYEEEADEVFEKCWIPVCRAEEVAKPGQYVTSDIVGNPFVIIRGTDGVLRAFHNVCRHKGHAVALENGHCSQFVCPYHGWVYGTDGCLKTAPHLGKKESFDVKRMGLKPIAVDTWGPFVFVDLDAYWTSNTEVRTRDLQKDMLPLQSLLDQMSHLKWVERRVYDIKCNWKVFIDNSLDGGYHVAYAHESLAQGLEFKGYETIIQDRTCVQVCDTQGTDKRLGEKVTYAWAFPNFFINRYGRMMDTNIVVPTGVDTCQVIFDFFFDYENLNDWDVQKTIRKSIETSEIIQEEDIKVCESVQRGMNSMSYTHGQYSSLLEQAVRHFHILLWKEIEKVGA